MRRRFGQWNEDEKTKKPSKIQFYEYVEAVKLTGDAYVPAGQVVHSFEHLVLLGHNHFFVAYACYG